MSYEENRREFQEMLKTIQEVELEKSRVYLSEFARFAPLFRNKESIPEAEMQSMRILRAEYEERFDITKFITVYHDGSPMDPTNQDNVVFTIPPERMPTSLIDSMKSGSLEYLHNKNENETHDDNTKAYYILAREFVQSQGHNPRKLAAAQSAVIKLSLGVLKKTNPEKYAELVKNLPEESEAQIDSPEQSVEDFFESSDE
jgi:hypothetical protein